MKVRGRHRLDAPPAEVFAAIEDPSVLMAVIPGCEGVERVGPDEYRGRISLRLPGFAGSYATTVRLVDAVPPERAALDGRVDGSLGTIAGRATFTLRPTGGGTLLEYDGDARIDGPLARLDSRFAERLAESLIAQGLRALDARLSGSPSEPPPVLAGVAAGPSAHVEADG